MAEQGLSIPISADLSKFEKSMEGLSKKMNDVGKNLTKKLTLPIAAVGTLATKAAADLKQTEQRVETMFGNMADSVWEWANESERALGLGAGTIAGMTSDFADLTMGLGMTAEASKKMGQSATEMAVILGNWGNVSATDAMADIQSAVMGSTKAMEKYGVKLNSNVLSEKARAMGLGDSFDKLTEVQKAQVRYNAIMDASANAINYWEEGNRSLTFTLNEVKEQFTNIMENIGKIILPVIEKVVARIADMTASFAKFTAENPEITKILVGIGVALATIGPLIMVVSKGFKAFSRISLLFSPIGLTLIALAGAVGTLAYAIKNNIGGIGDKFKELYQNTKENLTNFVTKVGNALGEAKKEFEKSGMSGAIARFISEISGLDYEPIKKITDGIGKAFSTMAEITVKAIEGTIEAFKWLYEKTVNLGKKIVEAWNSSKDDVGKAIEKIKSTLDIILIPAIETVQIIIDEFKQLFGEDFHYIKDTVKTVVDAIKSVVENVWIPVWKTVGAVIGGVILLIIQTIKAIAPYISEFAVGIMGVINVVATVINGIATVIGGIIDFIINTFTYAWNCLKNVCDTVGGLIIGAIQVFAGLFTGNFETMKNGVILIWEKLKTGVSNAVNNLLDWIEKSFGELPSKMLQWGKDAIAGFVNGVKEKVGGAIETIKNTASNIANGFKSVLKINSPSRLFRQYGEWTSEGLAIGIEDGYRYVEKATRGLAETVTDNNIINTFDGISRKIEELGNTNIRTTVTAERVQRYKEFNIGAQKQEAVVENVITLNGKVITQELSPKFNIENGSRIKLDSRRMGVK